MEELSIMIEDCITRESLLSEWESGFIESIGDQLTVTGGLSPKQVTTLEEIWDRITSNG